MTSVDHDINCIKQFDKLKTTICDHSHFSDKYEYLYIDTPKVACSTVKHTLQSAEVSGIPNIINETDESSYGYSNFLLNVHNRSMSSLGHFSDFDNLINFAEKARCKFCFSRNPYSRVLSAYLDKIFANEDRMALFLEEFGDIGREFNRKPNFIEFLELVKSQNIPQMNAHWRPQHYHVINSYLNYDFIGSFERFSEDFSKICSIIDPMILKHFRTVDEHKTNSERYIQSYYKDDLAGRLVREIYAEDFASLGYSQILEDFARPPV